MCMRKYAASITTHLFVVWIKAFDKYITMTLGSVYDGDNYQTLLMTFEYMNQVPCFNNYLICFSL